jgi:glycosyltransferase involved in cell wall biosynthesis
VKVLISAYACEPGKGSEPGVGWNWSLAAAERHEVWVMTRSNNRDPIEDELARSPRPSLRFVYLDLPPWALGWKRGRLGLRVYYLLWQLLVAREARRLEREHEFEVVHHLTFANVWLPALACLAGTPFVLGPVGGGQRAPLRLYRALGPWSTLQELIVLAGRGLARLNPLVRVAWKRAAVILVNNEETRRALPGRYRAKAVLLPNFCTREELAAVRRDEGEARELVAVYAGRLNRFKGVELGIRALALAPGWKLVVVGEGPDEARLRHLTDELGLSERVRFAPWLGQQALWETMAGCRALLFPSLKEGAPSIVAEARALGLPVVAFDRGGVVELARREGAPMELVSVGSWSESIQGLAEALLRVELDRPSPAESQFGLANLAHELDHAYRRACATSGTPERVAA